MEEKAKRVVQIEIDDQVKKLTVEGIDKDAQVVMRQELSDEDLNCVAGGARRPSNLLHKSTQKVNFGDTLYAGDTNHQAGDLLYKEGGSKGKKSSIVDGIDFDEDSRPC
jgi:hypothetical protein